MLAGAGYYAMAKDQLERFRAAVDDDATGTEVARSSPALAAAGYSIGAIDELKTAPRGFPKDHPRIELLRRKGLMASRAVPGAGVDAHDARRSPRSARRGPARQPLCAWLDAHVGPSTLPPDEPASDVRALSAVCTVGRSRRRRRLDRMSSVTVTDAPHADVLESLFGLADRVVDDDALANSVERFRERGIALPTFAELADPSTIDPARVGDADPQGRRRPQPVARPLVQRPRRRPGRRARARRAAVVA